MTTIPASPDGALHLGETIDPATHARTGTEITIDPATFTTHGVIVGMTGSGKTGLGIVLLEEVLLSGIPALIIDPKGDLPNLSLRFPDLAAADFAPWVEGDDPAAVAKSWSDGLAGWGITGERIRRSVTTARVAIYTPGSTAGIPVNLTGSLRAPATADEESRNDEVTGVVDGLLGLVGIESDALSGREHILLANLIDAGWRAGRDLDLPTLLAQVQDPPIRKLGVLDLETFYPAKDRMALVLKLNGLIASPSFAAWAAGMPLDIDAMLWDPPASPGGPRRPKAAIVSVAHLDDNERQFAVTAVLGRLVTWMRAQAGTANLKVLVYFDELLGFAPPSATPPAKKPILTILKQGRAFGVGLVLATQNPVDLDYRAISNAGTWMVGRLQTERDRDRLLDGMRSAAGGVDADALAATLSGLGKREFVLHRASSDHPAVFTSRWSMSYLRGPLSREQIGHLMADAPERTGAGMTDPPVAAAVARAGPAVPAAAPAPLGGFAVAAAAAPAPAPAPAPASDAPAPVAPAPGAPTPALAEDETTVAPRPADGIRVYHVAPAAAWLADVGGLPGGTVLAPAAVARLRLLYDDDKAALRHSEEWEAVFTVLGDPLDASAGVHVDYDDRDLRADPPPGAAYRLPGAALGKAAWWKAAQKALTDHLLVNRTFAVQRNLALKLWSRPDETAEAFANRCETVADMKADEAGAALRAKWDTRLDRVRAAQAAAQRKADEAAAATSSQKQNEWLGGAGDVLSMFLGGRRGTRSIGRAVRDASQRRATADRAADRAASAASAAADKAEEIEKLQAELSDAILAIDAEWSEKAEAVESVDIPLERCDITVVDFALLWLPVG